MSPSKKQQHVVEHHDSSDDEAPEAFTKESAKEIAVQMMRDYRNAARSQPKKKKTRSSKKAEKAEKDSDDEKMTKEEEEVDELPADVIAAIAARDEEQEEDEVIAAQQKTKKLKKLAENRQHIRQFGNITVQRIEDLEAEKLRRMPRSAGEFLKRMNGPNRKRMDVLEGHPSRFSRLQKRKITA